MKPILIFLCLTLLNIVGVLPQQSSDWPPDPASLFTDAVKILQVDSETHSGLLIDSLDRQIVSADGRTFPWPDAIEDIDISESRLIIDGMLYFYASPRADASSDWRLDLMTGKYTPMTDQVIFTQCGKIDLDSPQLYYPWILQYRNKHWQFCKVTTGWLSVPLPKLRIWKTGGDPWEESVSGPVVSPDEKWVVIFGYKTDLDMAPSAYAFNLYTGQLNYLGFFKEWADKGFERYSAGWVDDHTVQLYGGGSREWSIYGYYIADINRPNSMKLISSAVRRGGASLDNPPREEVFFTPSTTGQWMEYCRRSIYDYQSDTTTTYEYPGSMCVTEYGPFDGDGYYRDVPPERKTATLVRYNPVTRQRTELFKGEIEHVLWVSPDEHYAALIMDTNGRISNSEPGSEAMDTAQPMTKTAYLALLELPSGEVLYKQPAHISDSYYMMSALTQRRQQAYSSAVYGNSALYFWFPFVEQLTPDWLLLIDETKVQEESRESYGPMFKLLHIEGKTVTNSDIPVGGDVTALKPGDGRLLIWTDGEGKSTLLSLYDPATGKITPLIKANDRYAVFLLTADAGVLTLVVTPRGQDQSNFLHKMTYKLQLPG